MLLHLVRKRDLIGKTWLSMCYVNTERPTESHDFECSDKARCIAEFPALADLGLDASDLSHLSSQGFVSPEQRGNQTYYKLRFRRAGKQVVRYIGTADRASVVE